MRLLKIGRDKSNNIVLPSPRVSSAHAEITILNNGDMLLEDKNSLNGTFVMNKRILPGASVSIKRGDAIRFADMELDWGKVPEPPDIKEFKAIYGIGKNVLNEIQLQGATVSRFHATYFIGKDGKRYIEDHSKNGTTVNGTRINSGQRVRVKRKDAIACGGVPVIIPGPKDPVWLKILLVAALVILVILGIKYFPIGFFNREKTDSQLYDRYKNATCMVVAGYHYDVSIPNVDLNKLNAYFNRVGLETIPTRIIRDTNGQYKRDNLNSTEYSGTGFFVSNNGQVATNLHVVKPWLADIDSNNNSDVVTIKQIVSSILTQNANTLVMAGLNQPLNAYISSIEVSGVLDYIGVIPNNQYIDGDNIVKCRPIYDQGDNLDVDVALITTVNGDLPKGCSYVNVKDSIRTKDDECKVGSHIYTIGFPAGINTQNNKEKLSTQGYSGNITQIRDQYSFGHDATSAGGASGSPIFDKYGYLVGVANSGLRNVNINYGIKGRYVKEMMDKIN